MVEVIEGLYPIFLDMGYSPSLFWSLSLDEIYDLMESYTRKEERKRKEKEFEIKDIALLLYNQAMQTGEVLGQVLHPSADWKRTSLSEYYPNLFGEPKEFSEKNKIENELMLHKARMEDFAFRHNEARKKRGDNDRRNDA